MGTTTFVWDPVFDCVTHELDENNAVKAVYHNEPQQYGGVLSQRRGTTSHYHHHDALGSTRFLTDNSSNVTDTYLHDAWGNLVASTGSTVNPFQWVGKYGYYTDISTAQVYVRARMYQPNVARWSRAALHQFNTPNADYLLSALSRTASPNFDDSIAATNGIHINVRNTMDLCSGIARCGCKEIRFEILYDINAPKLKQLTKKHVVFQRIRSTMQYGLCHETCEGCFNGQFENECGFDVYELLGTMPVTDKHSGVGKARHDKCVKNCAYKQKTIGEVRVYEMETEPPAKMTVFSPCKDCIPGVGYNAVVVNGNEHGTRPDYWNKKPLLWALYAYTYQTSCCDDPPSNEIGYTFTLNNIQRLNISPDGTVDVSFPE